MKRVMKKEGKIVQAYCLGERSAKIDELLKGGKIRRVDKTHWRVFSRESRDGEEALSGDYIKIDSSGLPYPNNREYFLNNHRHINGDNYEQIPQMLNAWSRKDGMCPEIRFLQRNKGLVMNEDSEEAYFQAPLWGDILSVGREAVIIFYDLQYNLDGTVRDAEFNFVARDEFYKTYEII